MASVAKAAYRPLGLVTGLGAGVLAGALFKQVWRRISGHEEAPDALESEYGVGQLLLAAVIQAAIFAGVKVLVDRGGAKVFERLTGAWPGD